MKILHITDFHYSDEAISLFDQGKLVDALIRDLSKESVEYLIFTGDLVFSGKKETDFIEAKKLLIDKLCDSLRIPKENVFICGGNHDVYRGQELEDTTDKINSIGKNEDLELFLKKQDGKSFKESLKNLTHYNNFAQKFYEEYSHDSSNSVQELYTVHKRKSANTSIGILTINSAWRAIDSKTDRGNLLFPISILKKAIDEVKQGTDFRIMLMHHPVSDFKDWNASNLENNIHTDFHMLFSGHLHKKKQNMQICTDEGIFCCSSAATLSDDGSLNGYTLIDIDIETYEMEISNSYYMKQDDTFLHSRDISKAVIPVGPEKQESNNFKKTIRKKHNEEMERANELFISYDEKESGKGFEGLFTEPILKPKNKAQIAQSKSDSAKVPLQSIVITKENYVIYGKDKSGRTSILYKCFLEMLADFTLHKTIPLYINAREYKAVGKVPDIYKLLRSYYELSNSKTKELIAKYQVRLLIDNYDPGQSSFNEMLNSFLNKNKDVTFIVTSEEKLATSFAQYEFDGRGYTDMYIHEISRPEVRTLAGKWPNLTQEKREIILEKIFGIFTQLNIPANYWTVSLFIWIFEKDNDANFHSSFELIQLYIDSLLDRKRLALDKNSKLTFEEFKSYLASLSHFFIKRSKTSYTATYAEIVEFTSEYRVDNKRFVIEVKDVVDLVIERNILRKAYEDAYTFRLNGVFEYFIALYMNKDEVFKNKVIEDDHYYLSFKNELELYAGFQRNEEAYLLKIFERTKQIFSKVHNKYGSTRIDEQLTVMVSEVFDLSMPLKHLEKQVQQSFTVERQDELMNEMQPAEISRSEVKLKEYYETLEENAENLEKSLHILARVFRNSNLNNEEKLNQILDFILESSCYMGFRLIDDAELGKIPVMEPADDKVIVKLMTNFMPLMVQTFLYDAVGQNDLERILLEKITVLKKESSKNQFVLMLLYFTLIDLNVAENKQYIPEVIEILSLEILQQTAILKLYVYLIFKCTSKPYLEIFMKEQIQKLTLKINPKTDRNILNKGLSNSGKLILAQRNQNMKK